MVNRFFKSIAVPFLFLFCLCVLLYSVPAWALELNATIDRDKITLDEEAKIIVTINGRLRVSEPVIPAVSGVEIVRTGTSSNVQIVNGSFSTSSTYVYTVVPVEVGTHQIPPFEIHVGNETYKTRSFSIKVTKVQYSKPPPGIGLPPLPNQQGQASNAPMPSGKEAPRFWISTYLDKKEAYLSQQVLFRFKLYTQESIETGNLSLPQFSDFWNQVVVAENRGREIVNGQSYSTLEKVVALFPLKAGELSIGETKLDVAYYERQTPQGRQWDPFFKFTPGKLKKVVLRAPPIPLTVKSLPRPLPENFSGLVGDFGMQVKLSDQELRLGETATLEIILSGAGNVRDAQLPAFDWKGFKIYDAKPELDVHESNRGLSGSKTFRLALVPSQAGSINIPSFSVSYFDPNQGDYKTLAWGGDTLQVLSADGQQSPDVYLPNEQDDALPVNSAFSWPQGPSIDRSAELWHLSHKQFVTVLLLFAAGFVLLFVVFTLRRFVLVSRAHQEKKALQKALRLINKSNDETLISQALRAYFALVFSVPAQGLTMNQVCELIKKSGATDLAENLKSFWQGLDQNQYGFEKTTLDSAWRKKGDALLKQVPKLVKNREGVQ